MNKESQFFKLPNSDKLALSLIILYVVGTFLLINSSEKIAGIAIFGWLMGLLMFLAPIISLIAMQKDKY
jgi:hypothetical protein